MKKYLKTECTVVLVSLLERGECDIMDFKEQLSDKMLSR